MRNLAFVVGVAFLATGLAGCEMSASPTSPTPPPQQTPPPAPAPIPTPPTGPPFSVSLAVGASPAYPGRVPIAISIVPNINIISAERPSTVRLTCAGRTISQDIGIGRTDVFCDFPDPGTYPVQATVTGSAGFAFTTSTAATVLPTPVETLTVFYSVVESDSDETDVVFSVRTIAAADKFSWTFGDGSDAATTLLPMTRHRFEKVSSGSNERVVTVTVTDASGRTIATGRVIGRW